MIWQFSPNEKVFFITGIVALTTALINWRYRKQPGVGRLALFMLFIAIWSFANNLELASAELGQKSIFLAFENLAASICTIYLLLFILEFNQSGHMLPLIWRRMMWAEAILFFFIEVTNPWHHLYRTGFIAEPSGSNLLYSAYGPFGALATALSLLFEGLIFYFLVRLTVSSKGWHRQRALSILIGLLIPFTGYLLYLFRIGGVAGLDLQAVGFTINGMILTWIVFEDLQRQLIERTQELDRAILSLNLEIEARNQLENDLRHSQDSLSSRLADQSQKLSGLYDMILMSSQVPGPRELPEQLLEKVLILLNCNAACIYHPAAGSLHMEAHQGLSFMAREKLVLLPNQWLVDSPDVRAEIDFLASSDLPVAFISAGFRAGLFKWVDRQDQESSILMALWQQPRHFSVEEISLFHAAANAFGVILENFHLRQRVTDAAIQQERRRLARNLHDSVTQSLHSLVLSAETAEHLLGTQPARLNQVLAHLTASARLALKEMRLLLFELRLVALDKINLVDALNNRLEAVERRAGVDARLEIAQDLAWPEAWGRELYPIATECLNNALKYAHASVVEIFLRTKNGHFEMLIQDNGCGFDPRETDNGGMGLHTMVERAENLNGRLEIQSAPGQGTRIVVTVPETQSDEERIE